MKLDGDNLIHTLAICLTLIIIVIAICVTIFQTNVTTKEVHTMECYPRK